VTSLINGPILGVFLIGALMPKVHERPALIGMLVSCVAMLVIRTSTPLAWTWYVLVGSAITVGVAALANLIRPSGRARRSA
jgi:solute:Na+ symporter, SSS family